MNRPLRVVHVTLGLDVGGQEQLLVEMARHADPRRVSLLFVSLTGRGALADDIEACGWPVTALGAPPGLRPGLVARLACLFRRTRPDIVHTHDDRPNIHGAPAARLAGVPVVIHTRHHQGAHLSGRQRLLVRLVSSCDDRFVCISHDSRTWACRQGISPHRLRVLHNGIDLMRFAYRGPDPTGYAVLVARLSPEKGIDVLLQAMSRMVPNQADFRVQIAGDGPGRATLEQQARQLGVDGHVRFLGTVRDVPELLAGARLFVLPSRTEGISLTLLEAMARGLPVVATNVGGNPEVVANGETGLLVPPDHPQELAQAIGQLWNSPDLGARMGERGRQRVCEQFDIKKMVAEYEALYRGGLS
jgi:glycosyltransferase involved in cell wall biosynthesis